MSIFYIKVNIGRMCMYVRVHMFLNLRKRIFYPSLYICVLNIRPWPSSAKFSFTNDLCLYRLILGLLPANETRRDKVTPSLIGWAQTLNQPSYMLVVMISVCDNVNSAHNTQWYFYIITVI